jgi:predicted DNA-binding transcriptional regulator YafY
VDRLRGLGYPVAARPGVAGGYRLGAGGTLRPLVLDEEEAVAVVIGLRTAANGSIAGIEETSLRALAKLQQVLPSRLRHRVSALQSHALQMPSPGPHVDPDVLTVIANACRDHHQLRFDYQTHSGDAGRRSVEPYRLINDRRRWYLVSWDLDRAAWRTFRVDRMKPRTPTGSRFTPRALPPDQELMAQVARGIGEATWRYRARVVVHAPAAYVRTRLPIPVGRRAAGRRQVQLRTRLGPPGDARAPPGHAGRGLRDRRLARRGGRPAQAPSAVNARSTLAAAPPASGAAWSYVGVSWGRVVEREDVGLVRHRQLTVVRSAPQPRATSGMAVGAASTIRLIRVDHMPRCRTADPSERLAGLESSG